MFRAGPESYQRDWSFHTFSSITGLQIHMGVLGSAKLPGQEMNEVTKMSLEL